MTLLEIWNLRMSSGDMKARVSVAVAAAANGVLLEDVGTTNHAARLVWAKAALLNIPAEMEQFFWALCGNVTFLQLGAAIDDGSLQYVINTFVDIFAGV